MYTHPPSSTRSAAPPEEHKSQFILYDPDRQPLKVSLFEFPVAVFLGFVTLSRPLTVESPEKYIRHVFGYMVSGFNGHLSLAFLRTALLTTVLLYYLYYSCCDLVLLRLSFAKPAILF